MKFFVAAAAAMLAMATAAPAGVELAKSLATNMEIRVGVTTNQPNADKPVVDCGALGADWALCGLSYINIDYTGSTVTAKNWAIYFHSIRRLLELQDETFTLTFIEGDLYKMEPSDKFVELASGLLKLPVVYEYWMIFDSDFIPRYWVVVDEDASTATAVPNTDTATDQSSFEDTISGDNWIRVPGAPLPQANLSTRYEKQDDLSTLPYSDIEHLIVPTPLKTTRLEGTADISKGINIVATGLSTGSINTVYARLKTMKVGTKSGYKVTVSISKKITSDAAKTEGYTLKVEASGATVVGYDAAGAFYGLQSLVSLVKIGTDTIPCVDVVDAPYFPDRRQHIDIGRNFHTKAFLLRAIEQMAAYKINQFHFHITDDEGWRLEIPGLPELTEVGSKRCHDMDETKCLIPLLGSGPTSDNFGSGFITRKEYIEIVKFAKARFIEVFPEVDMPGHCRAAVVAMEARYQKYAALGDMKKAEQYRLLDPNDTSKFLTVQFYGVKSQINSCMPGAIPFVRKLITEVVAMHKEAGQPLKKWHFGADEAHNILLGGGFVDETLPEADKVGKGQINVTGLTQPFGGSPVCQEFFKEHDMVDGNALIGYLAVELSKILNELGVETFMAWQDGMTLTNASSLATKENVLNYWDTLFWGGAEGWVKWWVKGYKMVLSCPDFLYFDFPSENNVLESGYYWAGRDQSVKKLFDFAPMNLAQNAETGLDRDGAPYSAKSPVLPEGLTNPIQAFTGLSGQLWSEIVRTDEKAEYMLLPRMIALAERAWHKASWELDFVEGREFNQTTEFVDKDDLEADYNKFTNILGQREVVKLEASGFGYRVPVPGAVIEDGKLKTNIDLPGIPIWYSADGKTFTQAEGDVEVPAGTETCYIQAGYGDHRSRTETITV